MKGHGGDKPPSTGGTPVSENSPKDDSEDEEYDSEYAQGYWQEYQDSDEDENDDNDDESSSDTHERVGERVIGPNYVFEGLYGGHDEDQPDDWAEPPEGYFEEWDLVERKERKEKRQYEQEERRRGVPEDEWSETDSYLSEPFNGHDLGEEYDFYPEDDSWSW